MTARCGRGLMAIRSNASTCQGARAELGQCLLPCSGPSAKSPPAWKPRNACQPLCDVNRAGRGRGRPQQLPGPRDYQVSFSQKKWPFLSIAGANPAAVTCVTPRTAGSGEYRAKSIPAPRLAGGSLRLPIGSCICLCLEINVLHHACVTSQNKSPEQGTDLEERWHGGRDARGKNPEIKCYFVLLQV